MRERIDGGVAEKEALRKRQLEEALAHGIIDGLAYEDDFENKIKEALKIDSNEGLNEVYFGDINVKVQEYDKEIDDRIAVVYAQGPIFNTEAVSYTHLTLPTNREV